MNNTFLSDFCTIYRIPKIQEKLNTLYPNFDQKIPYTWIKMTRDTVYPKPLAGPDQRFFFYRITASCWSFVYLNQTVEVGHSVLFYLAAAVLILTLVCSTLWMLYCFFSGNLSIEWWEFCCKLCPSQKCSTIFLCCSLFCVLNFVTLAFYLVWCSSPKSLLHLF